MTGEPYAALSSVPGANIRGAVLGIDAAWTPAAPSAVALLESRKSGWRCTAVAPSYASFMALAAGRDIDWHGHQAGGPPEPAKLLDACAALTASQVSVAAVDMPLSNEPIRRRRQADDKISRAFGNRQCSTHSPNELRPGELAERVRDEFKALGFALAVTSVADRLTPALIEVYPHAALLALCRAEKRVAYKVSRSNRYWPKTSVRERIVRLLAEFQRILSALTEWGIHGVQVPVPHVDEVRTLRELKPYEDAIDAVVSAWVGVMYLYGRVSPYGDDAAAIWVP